MGKPALGKGLGQLMRGQPVAGKPSEAPEGGAEMIKVEFGRGLSTLVSKPAPATEEAKKILLPPWFFFAADILLLAFSVAVCFDAPKPYDAGTLLFCATSITFGALLGVAGVLRAAE